MASWRDSPERLRPRVDDLPLADPVYEVTLRDDGTVMGSPQWRLITRRRRSGDSEVGGLAWWQAVGLIATTLSDVPGGEGR